MGAEMTVEYVRLSAASETIESGSLWQIDYSLTNAGDEPSGYLTIDIDVTDPNGYAASTVHTSTPGTVDAGATVEWCWLSDNALANTGTYDVTVHLYDDSGDYGTYSVAPTVTPSPDTGPAMSGGSTQISIGNAVMSDGDTIESGALWTVQYEVSNGGDAASNPLSLETTVYGPDGGVAMNPVVEGFGVVDAGQTVTRWHLADQSYYGTGTFTVRLHLYDAEADYGYADATFTMTAPADTGPSMSGGSTQISLENAQMSDSDTIEVGSLWTVQYDLVNAGDAPSNPLTLEVTVYGPDGSEMGTTAEGIGTIEANQTVTRWKLADHSYYNTGTYTVRLHLYDAEADYGYTDVLLTMTSSADAG